MASATLRAVDTVELTVGNLEGRGVIAEGVRLVLRPGTPEMELVLQADSLRAGEGPALRSVYLECAAFLLQGGQGECSRGLVRFEHPWLGGRSVPVTFSYRHPGRLDLRLHGFEIAGGTVRANFRLFEEGRWQLEAAGEGLDLQAVAALSAAAGRPWPVSASGDGRIALAMRGEGVEVDGLEAELAVDEGAFASADALQAGEGLGAEMSLSMVRGGDGYRLDLSARWARGGLYVHPVYVEADTALTLSLSGRFAALQRRLFVDAFELEHPGVLHLAGKGDWNVDRGRRGVTLDIEADHVRLPKAYEIYAQPFLPGTPVDALETGGLLAGRFAVADGAVVESAVNAVRVSARDRMGRFGLDGLDAALYWDARGQAPVSRISVDAGHLYGIGVGPVRMQPVVARDGFHLPSAVHLPVLDGALEIRDLQVAGLGGNDLRWRFDGGLTPVSMQRLTAALGWPELSGTLAGIIPDVRYERRQLTVGGRLLVRAFDGNATLGGLRLRDPLGVAPELSADVEIRGLDLAELTGTFDVGRITGRLDGEVRELVLVRWSPVRFDASLYTPPDDTSTRRISQRAVDSLTQIGGGVGGVLSGGFLRFFEDFNYRRLGLSCRLEGEICHMDGVAPAPQGYYLVQGAGLPRIDVIGYTRQVAWRDLVSRVVAVVQQEDG